MWSTAREIASGDLVIAWLTREAVQPLIVTPGKEFNGRFGVYRHSDLVGVPYGSKIGSRNGKGFIHVLRPTPELWTMALPHRTQILYLADISFIVSYLNIKSGSQVIEAGTGSGSFSHSVARTIGTSGHLYSYEFHEARANKAREEFRQHGLMDTITLTYRNVCKDGFTIVDQADSVFLDLPAPWDAVQHAKKALRKDRTTRICCFSPCMEQVLRTVSALNEAGFTDVTMYETLIRPHEVYTVPAPPSIAEVSEKLKKAEARREEKRLKQIAAAQERREKGGKKRKRELELHAEGGNLKGEGNEYKAEAAEGEALGSTVTEEAHIEVKKPRMEEGETAADTAPPSKTEPVVALEASCSSATAHLSSVVAGTEGRTEIQPNCMSEPERVNGTDPVPMQMDPIAVPVPPPSPILPFIEPQKSVFSKVATEVRGHTSYLTFAVLLPAINFTRRNKHLIVDEGSTENLAIEQEPSISTTELLQSNFAKAGLTSVDEIDMVVEPSEACAPTNQAQS